MVTDFQELLSGVKMTFICQTLLIVSAVYCAALGEDVSAKVLQQLAPVAQLSADLMSNNESESVVDMKRQRLLDSDSATNLSRLYESVADSPCLTNADCTHKGVCVRQHADNTTGYCQCYAACYSPIPLHCPVRNSRRGVHASCLTLGAAVLRRTDGRDVSCDTNSSICVCPSTNDEACHKADVRLTHTGDVAPLQGQSLTLTCCLTGHPRDLVVHKAGESERVYWLMNGTVRLEPTTSPLRDSLREANANTWFDRCWRLHIARTLPRDTGLYTCTVELYPEPRLLTRTLAVVVRAPVTVTITNLTALNSSAISVQWITAPTPGQAVNLRLSRSNERETAIRQLAGVTDGRAVLGGLAPATFYTVHLETVPHNNLSGAVTHDHVQTSEARPGRPQRVQLALQSRGRAAVGGGGGGARCELSWTPPGESRGRIMRYEARVSGRLRADSHGLSTAHRPPTATAGVGVGGGGVTDDYCADLTRIPPRQFMLCVFDRLLPNRNYTAAVVAVNAAGKSDPATSESSCVTGYGVPDVVPAPSLSDKPPTIAPNITFELTFDSKPDQVNGPIACYYIAIVPLPADATPSSLTDYLPPSAADVDVEYATSVAAASTDDDTRRRRRRTVAYIAEAYETLPERTVIGDGKSSGAESNYCRVKYHSRYPAHDMKIHAGGRKYTGFLIVRIEPDESVSYNGDDVRWRRQVDGRLQPIYGYSRYFPLVQIGQPVSVTSEVPPSSSWLTVFWVLLIIFFLLVFAAFGVVYFLQKRGFLKSCFEKNLVRDRDSFESLTKRNTKDYHSIPVADLANEYIIRHRDSDFLFSNEFETLPHYHLETKASDLEANAGKNRYNDIKAFDCTRVKLKVKAGEPASDYINASFIQGYQGRKVFIAAQGPLLQTEPDFWRMVWEQRVQIVIMVTNLYEKHRHQCQKYWPDDECTRYGLIDVTPLDSTYYADYTVRTFDVANKECEDSYYDTVPLDSNGDTLRDGTSVLGETALTEDHRTVTQYHYTAWSDYRAPECTTGLLRFLMQMRKLPAYNSQTPVVIHCSAGVGRTGTFVAIDGQLDQCLHEGKADVYAFVAGLRRQRNFMVQSLEQYVFVYKALAEWHSFGETDMDADQLLNDHRRRLLLPPGQAPFQGGAQGGVTASSTRSSLRSAASPTREAPGGILGHGGRITSAPHKTTNNTTGLEAEFAKLSLTLEETRSSSFGLRDEHAAKNRRADCVPFDRNRLILTPIVGHVGDASYINASIVKGYFYPYILAQDPLDEATCYDFWRMVCEHDSGCIVTLSQPHEFAAHEQFWCEPTTAGTVDVGETSDPQPDQQRRRVFGKNPQISVELLPDEDGEDEDRTPASDGRPTPPAVFVTRRMRVKSSKEADSRQVVQFHFVDWPPSTSSSSPSVDDPKPITGHSPSCSSSHAASPLAATTQTSCPASTASLLTLIGRVLQCQSARADAAPIIVHCRNGSTKSGLYCLVSLLLERLKAEGRIDVFQTAKNLRSQRPMVLSSVDQYMFAYQCIIDYLESFR